MTDDLSIFGFDAHVSVIVGCAYLVGAYLLAIGPARRRYGWSDEGASVARRVSWFAGVGVIFFSLNGPLHTLADESLFSAHMVQHLLLMLIMPPLLIAGVPPWLIRKALERRWIFRMGRVLTHPAVAFGVYNAVLIGWHLPRLYNAALESHALHIVQHGTFMAAAVMMWWPIVNPVEELQRLPEGPLLMVYIFAFGLPAGILSAFITYADTVLYPWYGAAPRVFEGLGPIDDQRLGGVIMWVPGFVVFLVASGFVFFRWSRDEFGDWEGWPGRRAPTASASRHGLVLPDAGSDADPGRRQGDGDEDARVVHDRPGGV